MLLALDTATRFMSLALHDGCKLWFEATWNTPNNHTIELAPSIQQALKAARITPADLTAVAVTQGPGSFTGLRIGMSVAKGLAAAQNLALIAVPTLHVVAAGVPMFSGNLIAVLQAGRGRICAQSFNWTGIAWEPAGDPAITTWETVLDHIKSDTLIAGEIEQNGRALLHDTSRPVHIASGAFMLRRAGFLAEIGWARLRANETDDSATITPIYLHQPGVPHP